MNVSPIAVVARKEMTDTLRDRRSIYVMLCVALLGPLMLPFLISQISKQKKAAEDIQIPVVGSKLAPALVNWLGQQSGVHVIPGPADPEAAVRDHGVDVVLVVSEEFGRDFTEAKPAPIRVIFDSTRESTQPKLMRLNALLDGFNTEMAHSRLTQRGVNPDMITPIDVLPVDMANPQQRAAKLLNIILMFFAISILVTGTQIATDSTAGERERGSLEPLLLNPVPRWQLAGGKWFASTVAALIGLIATLLTTSFIVSRLSLEQLGLRFHLGLPEFLLLIAAMGPLAMIAPAVQLYLSCFAKSFKEAQSYILIMILPVTAVGGFAILYPPVRSSWVDTIPIWAQFSLGTEIVSGKVPSIPMLIVAAIEAALFAAMFLRLATHLLSKEKIIFGR